MQNYSYLENMSATRAKIVFNYRTRMANYDEFFRLGMDKYVSNVLSPPRQLAFNNCQVIKEEVSIYGIHEYIFKSLKPDNLAVTQEKLTTYGRPKLGTIGVKWFV